MLTQRFSPTRAIKPSWRLKTRVHSLPFIDAQQTMAEVHQAIHTNVEALKAAFATKEAPPVQISMSEFIEHVTEHRIVQVDVRQDGLAVSGFDRFAENVEQAAMPKNFDVITKLLDYGAYVNVVKPDTSMAEFANFITFLVQTAFFIVLVRMLFANMSNGAGGPGSFMKDFGQSKTSLNIESELTTTFDDIAGAVHAKEELIEVVDFLQNPDRYVSVGAKVPRGVLLYGEPGTGKTLLAKAVAGEAGVPFISCSGSEFMEMFVGVGASRIRNVFSQARRFAPCIVFIDEIDTIGKRRGMTNGNGEEREQTINQLLTLMDGFETNDRQIIVMAATNRLDVLDEALLRPGRFDRKIYVELPDRNGREDILKIHTRDKPLADDIDLRSIANMTVGFSGADLENLANEAAIYAARAENEFVTRADFDAAYEKITIGEEKRTIVISEEKKEVLAVHEAGHTLMALLLHEYDTVRKVSIVPRGMTGGTTWFEPSEDRIDIALMTREYFQHRIMVALGGRVAEEVVFGWEHVTTGASGDMQVVFQLANQMVTQYGFSRRVGPVNWQHHDQERDVQQEVRTLVQELYEEAMSKMTQHRAALDRLSCALLEKETLEQDEIIEIANVA